MTVKTRIAPSPTGDPHVGTAYIALFNYCFSRKMGGRFVLRIEDTDQGRSSPAYEQAIMEALRWLEINWDEGPDIGGPCGPYRQSERQAIYAEHASLLMARGEAYRCFCTAERLTRMREERKGVARTLGYDGHCRHLTPPEIEANLAAGLPFVIRLKMPTEGDTIIPDRLRGEVRYPNDQNDDQVLLKSDGFPTYHLANVVDDHLMGITHVIRAEEWIPSTPKHLRLYEAFGWQPPEFIHMPLLRNRDKSKISKRKNPTSINYYQRIGILPEVLRNFLGLMGFSLPEGSEKFTLEQMVEQFDIDRVSLGEPVFDLEKLNWLNGLYLREMGPDQLADRIISHQFNPEFIRKIAPLIQERIRRLDEFIPKTSYFFASELEYDRQLLLGKGKSPSEMVPIFEALADRLDSLRRWTREEIEEQLRNYGEESGIKGKIYFMPVRIAITGRSASPGLFETMEVIGKPLCQARMREAVMALKALAAQEQSGKETAPAGGNTHE